MSASREGRPARGHQIILSGLPIDIQLSHSGARSGTRPDGAPPSRTPKPYHGFISGAGRGEADAVQVVVRPGVIELADTERVFVIHPVDPAGGRSAAPVVMLGFGTPGEAQSAYQASPLWNTGRAGPLREMPFAQLRDAVDASHQSGRPIFSSSEPTSRSIPSHAPVATSPVGEVPAGLRQDTPSPVASDRPSGTAQAGDGSGSRAGGNVAGPAGAQASSHPSAPCRAKVQGAARAAIGGERRSKAEAPRGGGEAKQGRDANVRGVGDTANSGGLGGNPGLPGRIYTMVFQMKLKKSSYPTRWRQKHYKEANEALLKAMENDPEFAALMRALGIDLKRTKRGKAPRLPPRNWTWHHDLEPGVMQLVPRHQHEKAGRLQKAFHPGGRGGHSLWGERKP